MYMTAIHIRRTCRKSPSTGQITAWLDDDSTEADYDLKVLFAPANYCPPHWNCQFFAAPFPWTLEVPITDAAHLIELEWSARETCLRRIDSAGSGSTGPRESCAYPTAQYPVSVERLRVGMLDADSEDDFTIYLDAFEVTQP